MGSNGDSAKPNGGSTRRVLLLFENNDPQRPIIIGFIQGQPLLSVSSSDASASTAPASSASAKEVSLDKGKEVPSDKMKEVILMDNKKDIMVDGERIVFEAKNEIVLRCGKGSVTLRKDGKIVVKGTNLISVSKGMNKIKGAAVRVN